MHNLILIILALFSSISSVFAEINWPECSSIGGYQIPEELQNLDCDSEELAMSILLDNKKVAPTRMYHFGERSVLNENIRAKTVPQESWDRFIMGDQGRYQLKSFRKGLYGTATLDTNNFYNSKYSWLIEIHVRPECVEPKNVATLTHLTADPRFKKWFVAAKELPYTDLVAFKRDCYRSDGQVNPSKVDFYQRGESPKISETPCEKVISSFLVEAPIRIVHDEANAKSFYIRDRSCIENIKGTPEDLVQIFSERVHLWFNSCNGNPLKRNHKTNRIFSILFQSLKETVQPMSPETYNHLKANIGYLHDPHADQLRGFWASLLDAHKRCQNQNKMEEFRTKVSEDSIFELENYATSQTQFNKLCVGSIPDLKHPD